MNVKKFEDTVMTAAQRKAYAMFIDMLSEPFYCAVFDYNYDNVVVDTCGKAASFGFGYV